MYKIQVSQKLSTQLNDLDSLRNRFTKEISRFPIEDQLKIAEAICSLSEQLNMTAITLLELDTSSV